MDENYNGFNLITKEENILISSLFKAGCFVWLQRVTLVLVDRLNENLLLDRLEDTLEEIEMTPLERIKRWCSF